MPLGFHFSNLFDNNYLGRGEEIKTRPKSTELSFYKDSSLFKNKLHVIEHIAKSLDIKLEDLIDGEEKMS